MSNWADVTSREMDWTSLKLLLEGIEPRQVRKRYKKVQLGELLATEIEKPVDAVYLKIGDL